MDFCELDDPWGHVGKAREVLDFVSIALCRPMGQAQQIELNTAQCNGLMWILLACSETLKKAEEEAEKNENATPSMCNGGHSHSGGSILRA